MSALCCPVCGEGLSLGEHAYRCPKGHGFDRAASGYVNLLSAKEAHSKLPGDNADMVAARAAFLGAGYYEPLRRALAQRAVELTAGEAAPVVLDAGCGEGTYTAAMHQALSAAGKPCMAGLDLSKYALRRASKRCPGVEFVLGSLFHLPMADRSAHLVTDIFAPVCPGEFRRVLRDDGAMMLAVPGGEHLWGLKKLLYERPYQNDGEPPDHPGFTVEQKLLVESTITVDSQEDLWNLFLMTPYFWKTSREAAEKLRQTSRLETAISFIIYTMRKTPV